MTLATTQRPLRGATGLLTGLPVATAKTTVSVAPPRYHQLEELIRNMPAEMRQGIAEIPARLDSLESKPR